MVLIYCNQCFDTKEETHHKFLITSCKHVFCEGCVKIAITKNFCNICKKPCKVLPINEDLPAEVKNYFDSRSIGRLLENVEEISRFAETQNRSYVAKNAPYRDNYYKHKKSVFDMKKHIQSLDQAIMREKGIINRLRNAYKTNLITPDLFSIRSPNLIEADSFASQVYNKRSSQSSNRYFGDDGASSKSG